jgi:hypothetical protein
MTDPNRDGAARLPEDDERGNRGYDNAINGELPPVEVTLETVTTVIMDYFRDAIKPTITDNGLARVVPVVYATKERWATVRKDGMYRDDTGKQQLPIILVRRTAEKKGRVLMPMNKYLTRTITTGWNAQNAYDKFNVQNNIRPSQQIITVMTPDFMTLEFEIVMWTEYQHQMDALVEAINFENEDYWGNRNNYKFYVQIEDFTSESELPANDDRIIRSHFSMNVRAYLLPESAVANYKRQSTSTVEYSKKKVVAFIETVNDVNSIKK